MTERIIDFHTHAFADDLAPRAMKVLMEEAPDVTAYLDGTIGQLLGSMDRCGIEKSVICCIATRPSQFDPIMQWCGEVASDKIIPFPSIHPDDPDRLARISQIKEAGFKGIKMHPFYQDFYADEPRMYEMYEKICREDLILVMHTGYDIAFPRQRRADPGKLVEIKANLSDLKMVSTHMGAWREWDEVEQMMVGKEIFMEISFALEYMKPELAARIINGHPDGYILFGTDSPWTDQQHTLLLLEKLQIPEKS